MQKECKVASKCGGCQLQGIEYNKQLQQKQKKVESLLSRFHEVEPIIGSSCPTHYRNKVQVSFGVNKDNRIIVGNYALSSHQIIEMEDCMINDEDANKIIQSVKRLIIKYHISIFDETIYKGCMRHLLIRKSKNETMLVLVTGSRTIKNCEQFVKDILTYNPSITTIVQNINHDHTSMILGKNNIILYGKGSITDELCGLKFRISASSFYQVNKTQTEVLYKKAIELARFNKNDVLLDAYCGTGTIGLACSKYVSKVIGVEINAQAVKDAIFNKKNNHIENADFYVADAGEFMEKLKQEKTQIDVAIMDPPRTGSDYKFLSSLVKLQPNRIVYISCNPVTLRDDLRYLTKHYVVEAIQPVDMFPFTEHVETVVFMSKASNEKYEN